MVQNEDLRKKLSDNAMRLALELFDEKSVRSRFQQLLADLNLNTGNNYYA